MWIDRYWKLAVASLARGFPVVLLTGPRQVGKTSLLRHLYPRASYVTFDDAALARQAETAPDLFFERYPPPLIIDEVQYVPSLFRKLKQVVDRNPRPGSFFLTGSQTFPLMQNVSESLAGRAGVIEMNTLSWRELRHSKAAGRNDLDFLVRGGFPVLHASDAFERPADFYTSYLSTYLERDVRNMKNVGDLRDFDRLLRAAAARTGQILSYSDLARDVGIAPNTAKAWISVLQGSGQILLLEPYHRSLTTRLVKSPKLYFLDTGLACHLCGIRDVAGLLDSPAAGAMWETFVVGQIVRHHQVERARPPLWFWRTARGDEVDVLIEKGGRFTVIECKLGEQPDDGALRGGRALAAYYGAPAVDQVAIVCRTKHDYVFKSWPRARAIGISSLDAIL